MLLAVLVASATIAQLPAAAAETGGAGQVEEAPVVSNSPFDRQGMWIWYVDRSNGGSIAAIVAQAKRAGIGTVYVKAGDGGTVWSQFNKALVRALHRGGLDACAWQFVYGDHPVAEARAAAAAISRGADCFAIDAEGDYEGKYAAADLYVRTLRDAVGDTFPLSLAAFPYVDYHPSFPYSVFLGPGGATFNQPQMYWKTIGTSVRAVYEHTYLYNRIWGHPIYPIGQTYEAPSKGALKLFRRFAASFGGFAPSWWSWQETSGPEWGALGANSASRPLTGYRQEVIHPLLKPGSKGDMVVWAQERLVGAGQEVPVTGVFGKLTYRAVRAFQEGRGLPADGRIGTETWEALLNFTPYRVQWSASDGARGRAGASASGDGGRAASRPLSASLPAQAYEIPAGPRR
ncbi:MAG TPA: peptidoglycan-binding domain-containing protein [Solirubrobacterales bacterium]|nr:peptidoglycan-binding domain-containing protein [Solirubrobacterales bacterium]